MSRPVRLEGFSYRGPYRYFLTFCTYARRRTLADPFVVSLVLKQFRRTSTEEGFALLAYCVMPDHVHVLVEGTTAAADLRVFAALAKQRAGMSFARRYAQPLWQEGYYDRILREGDDARQIAAYILANPVRAGLVTTPFDYPHVGSDRWTLRELMDSVMFRSER